MPAGSSSHALLEMRWPVMPFTVTAAANSSKPSPSFRRSSLTDSPENKAFLSVSLKDERDELERAKKDESASLSKCAFEMLRGLEVMSV